MKRFMMVALVAAGVLTSTTGFAALEYSFDREAKVFTVKSEDIVSLEEGANELKVAFVKRYNLGPDKKGRVPEVAKPEYSVELYVAGSKRYEFADNVNYWQEHNYTYGEMARLKQIEAERRAIDKTKEANKAADEAAQKANGGKKVELTEAQVAERQALSERDEALALQQQLLTKTKEEKKRNASTLIYLEVENKLSREDTSKKLYHFVAPGQETEAEDVLEPEAEAQKADAVEQAAKAEEKPAAEKTAAEQISVENVVPDAALDAEHKEEGVNPSEQNLMELELARQAEQQRLLEEQQDRELLAKLNAEAPEAEETKALREKVMAREAAKKLAASEASEKKINDRLAANAAHLDQVRATREAFLKYQAEQAAAMEGMAYTSSGKGKLSAGDNFFKKVQDSLDKGVPLFFEVKFWNGGANERMWLKTEKLEELKELLAYNLYTDDKYKKEVLK